MTPDLMQSGAERWARARQRAAVHGGSGGRAAPLAHPVAPGAIDTSHGCILYVDDVHVSFDGYKALNGLCLNIALGELRAVIGPNGAGKTTMLDVITGRTKPDRGSVYLGTTIDLLRWREPQIAAMGVGRKFQKPTVFERLTVWENLELALAADKRVRSSITFRLSAPQRARLVELLELIHLEAHAQRPAGALSHGQKQWLEIGMLLAQQPRLLLLDEPVAGMTDDETERTAQLLRTLKGQHTLVVVEHDMAFVRAIADQVTVLCDGAVLTEGGFEQVARDPRVIEVYLGR
ncbi:MULTISPECIES: urea ABC transporter ATP-binding protein UrtD [Tepidimonas]|uniref:Sulfate/thiosulfate import ATP-binding protein CysA n=2 Tax=Tepidimonas TaxID=114248 RepID=A0A4R3L8M5_9BURK|nr:MULTISPECIES: urea ABC transporter ATP-binding protein UrtD [Tepidimonas]MCX7814207.1 urea ABC transporter ATP-binding protein UrtD [Tepidimonas ignava]TCS94574.1 urea transport system ATP-binding protein [Tepidimonas ignava]TSE18786.1 Sulfate/thiosulfate import ATP-binding protein CysA [Tepidimonas ignava]TSE27716.1 Sulfate/thiosulfate import ATP-binding protein CysA [Tepidimonas aquatica]